VCTRARVCGQLKGVDAKRPPHIAKVSVPVCVCVCEREREREKSDDAKRPHIAKERPFEKKKKTERTLMARRGPRDHKSTKGKMVTKKEIKKEKQTVRSSRATRPRDHTSLKSES